MKKLSITLLLAVMVLGLSSCDSHFWSTLSGSRWFAIEEVQGNFSRPLDSYDYDSWRYSSIPTELARWLSMTTMATGAGMVLNGTTTAAM